MISVRVVIHREPDHGRDAQHAIRQVQRQGCTDQGKADQLVTYILQGLDPIFIFSDPPLGLGMDAGCDDDRAGRGLDRNRHDRVTHRVGDDRGGITRHDIGTIGEPGDPAEPLGLTLSAEIAGR